jgi:hypothetical protein
LRWLLRWLLRRHLRRWLLLRWLLREVREVGSETQMCAHPRPCCPHLP